MSAVIRPRFYSHFAMLFAVLIFLAFSRTYYLRVLYDLPPLTLLVHLHGLVSTAWLALFIVQTRLVASRRVDLHMRLGVAGVGLASAMVVIGVLTLTVNAAQPGLRPSGLTNAQFTTVPLTTTVLFSVLFALALRFRRKSEFHKRLMVLAMISIIGPAVGRLAGLVGVGPLSPIIQPLAVLCLIAWCLAYDWRRHHSVHPVYAWGGLVLLASWPFRMWLARSDIYAPFADWLAEMGTFLVS